MTFDEYPRRLLTLTNPKTRRGEPHGYLTAILHLLPARTGAVNVCPYSSYGCRTSCLNSAGHGGIRPGPGGRNPIQLARTRRTLYWQADRAGFMALLAFEIAELGRQAEARGLRPAVRLNGTSDIRWELIPCRGRTNIMTVFAGVEFYDYTKWPLAARHAERAPGNYHLTFSLSESNSDEAARVLGCGLNVAAVFRVAARAAPLPRRHAIAGVAADVIDGDVHDLRFLDPAGQFGLGLVVGLRAKGDARDDQSGFAQTPNYDL